MTSKTGPNPEHARCWGCGYMLRGVESGRCPECGRKFDLNDPKSVNFGRPMGRVGRWMFSAPGIAWALSAAVASILICGTARPPVDGWTFSLLDLSYYGRWREWRGRLPQMTGIDIAYTSGLALWGLLIGAWVLRSALRGLVLLKYRPPRVGRPRFLRASCWLLPWLLIGFIGIGTGWPHRLGQRWMANVVFDRANPALRPDPWQFPPPDLRPLKLTSAQELASLRSMILYGSPRSIRYEALNLLISTHHAEAPQIIAAALANENDVETRVVAIRSLGMMGAVEAEPTLINLLDDREASIREAAADALNILQTAPRGDSGTSLRYDRPYAIDSSPNVYAPGSAILIRSPTAAARDRMERMMTSGPTLGEREAAARWMVESPPQPYQLRYAEWGVFMADSASKLELTRAQLDEVPSFVHRVGNPAKEVESHIQFQAMPVWKPVIHLTANRPMAVDLEVCLREGRPWVVYPRFDDLAVLPKPNIDNRQAVSIYGAGFAPLQSLDPLNLTPIADLREGYPWNVARHRTIRGPMIDATTGRGFNKIHLLSGIGVRWQSVIVSPNQLDWMKIPDVGPDPRFAWWRKLRQVNCSWVSSRGESEHFLYYDGPTLAASVVLAEINAGQLQVKTLESGGGKRQGMFIRVRDSGIAIQVIEHSDKAERFDVTQAEQRPIQQAEAQFLKLLTDRGLTTSEASGVLESWRTAFFQTPGQRFLSFMSWQDYDNACPMQMRPDPTETVRVGIVWTELKQ